MKFFLIGSLEDTGMIKFAEEVIANGHTLTSDPLTADRIVVDFDAINGRLDFIRQEVNPLVNVYSSWSNYSYRNFFK